MKQEDKELLLKDLCARLPYGVKIQHTGWDYDSGTDFDTVETLIGIDDKFIYTIWDKTGDREKRCLSISNWKLYLRPMSSMTEEEINIYHSFCECDDGDFTGETLWFDTIESFDYLNSIHIDYRGLIPKGLAIEAPKEMYN